MYVQNNHLLITDDRSKLDKSQSLSSPESCLNPSEKSPSVSAVIPCVLPSSLDTCNQVHILGAKTTDNSPVDDWEITRLKTMLAREMAKIAVIEGLRAAGREDMAGKISDCRMEYKVGKCEDCGVYPAYPLSCGERLCPDCSRARAERLIEEHHDVLAQIRAPKMLTLTFKPVLHLEPTTYKPRDFNDDGTKKPREVLKLGTIAKLREDFNRLLRLKLCESIWGGLYSFEFSYHAPGEFYSVVGKDGKLKRLLGHGWHPHIHAIIGSGFIDQDAISAAWEKITGCVIVDIRAIGKDEAKWDGIREVVKYSTKMVDFVDNPDLLEEFLNATEGVKLVQGFGALYRVSCKKHGDTAHRCPNCHGQNVVFVGGFGFKVSRYDERLRMVRNGYLFEQPGGGIPPEVEGQQVEEMNQVVRDNEFHKRKYGV